MSLPEEPAALGLDLLFSDHALGYWRVDGQGVVRSVNVTYCRMAGVQLTEVLGRHVSDLVTDTSPDEVAARSHQARISGTTRFTGRHQAADGSSILMDVQIIWIPGLKQTIAFLNRLDPAETIDTVAEGPRFRHLVERQGDGFTIVDATERITFANAASESLFGVSEGTLVGRFLHEFLDPGQIQLVEAKTRERQRGKEDSYELWIRRPDGLNRLLYVNVTRELDEAGAYLRSVGVFRDITDQRHSEDRLRASEARFRTVIEDAPMAIALIRNDCFLQVNRRFLDLYGLERSEEVLGRPIWEWIHPEDRSAVEPYRVRGDHIAVSTKELSFRALKPDGTSLLLQCWARPILLDDGWANLGFLQDVTVQRRLEEEREQLIQELKQALAEVRQLSGLLPICSHCKKIRDDQGYWNKLEAFISTHTEAQFTHGICPDCIREHFPRKGSDRKD